MTMNTSPHHTVGSDDQPPLWRRPVVLAAATAGVIGVFYLLREHWGHLLGLWTYLILLACPLMHLFHGHGGHGHGHKPDPSDKTKQG